jgi:integrase/recombinase XerD
VAIGSVIDFAIGEEDLAADHNAATAALERISERRDPIVLPEPAHIARVIAEASPNLAPIIAAALKTGCRKTELVTAQRRASTTSAGSSPSSASATSCASSTW